MRSSLFLLVVLAGCAPSERVGVQRQPLPMTVPPAPVLVGRSDVSRLGTSVAGCRFPGFVAGSPGDNFAAIALGFDGGVFWLPLPFPAPNPDAQGLFSVCEGSRSQWIAVSGSGGGVFWYSWQAQNSAGPGIRSVTRSQQASPAWLAYGVAGRASIDRRVVGDAGVYTIDSWDLRGDGGFGAAIAFSPDDSLVAVTDDQTSAVQLFDVRSRAPLYSFQGPLDAGFGSAVVMGDVHPNPGFEVLVSMERTREVLVLGKSGTGLVELFRVGPLSQPSNTGVLPLPVVIEPGAALRGSTLHAFWVGLPEQDTLYRFLGTEGQHLETSGPIAFGASLGVAENTLIIGAPGYEPTANGLPEARGAVFAMPFETEVLLSGEAQACSTSTPCVTSTCVEGTCLGGVICVPGAMPPLCPAAECRFGVCLSPPDAGVDGGTDAGFDAGNPDTGERDAGVPDAGVLSVDAGVKAGVQKFSACGCSADGLASTSLLALIIVALSRRRSGRPTC